MPLGIGEIRILEETNPARKRTRCEPFFFFVSQSVWTQACESTTRDSRFEVANGGLY